ncbi:MAG: DUF937 domain-containing protein, partial [Rhodothermia bacterium]
MFELSDLLGTVLDDDIVSRLAGQIGADSNSTSKALSSAMPALLAGLAD